MALMEIHEQAMELAEPDRAAESLDPLPAVPVDDNDAMVEGRRRSKEPVADPSMRGSRADIRAPRPA